MGGGDEKERRQRMGSEPSKKSVDEMLKRVARPERRSPLFWRLFDCAEELREAERVGGLGIPWRKLCVDWASEGVTAAGGKPLNWETARKTWQRVRKEINRVEERRERELIEREARRAADPRRNMPSRFGKAAVMDPPLSNVQPKPQSSVAALSNRQSGSAGLPAVRPNAPLANAVEDEPWRHIEIPEALNWIQIPDRDGQILDVRQFFRDDGVPEPWEAPEIPEDERIGCMGATIWSRVQAWSKLSLYERRFTKKW